MKDKDNRILKIDPRKIYAVIYVTLFFIAMIAGLLTNYDWSSYAYRVGDKHQHVAFIMGAGSEKNCHKRAVKKLSTGIQMTRYDQANAYFCGKVCFEVPLVQDLRASHVYCMIKVNGDV